MMMILARLTHSTMGFGKGSNWGSGRGYEGCESDDKLHYFSYCHHV